MWTLRRTAGDVNAGRLFDPPPVWYNDTSVRNDPNMHTPTPSTARKTRLAPRALGLAAVTVLALLGSLQLGAWRGAPQRVPVQSQERVVFPSLHLGGAGSLVRESGDVPFDLPALSALSTRWQQELPEGTSFQLAIRDDATRSWRDIAVDHDALAARDDDPARAWEAHDEALRDAVGEVVVARGQHVVLRATLTSTGPAASVTGVTALALSSPSAAPSALAPPRADAAAPVRIISRAEWGADESLRVYNENNPTPQVKGRSNSDLNARAIEDLGDEIAIAKTVSTDDAGRQLTWPMETSKVIKKIVVHHTSGAQPQTPDEAVAYLRSIYFFHAITRGWGDIGYNYVIDPFGNVYEGRAGGPRVVGAHAANFNIGSIGISVLGNYNEVDVTPAAKRALVALVHELSAQEGIDPTGSGDFRLHFMPNVIGHRDVGQTDCPGSVLWAELPDIRTMAAETDVADADPRWLPTLRPPVYHAESTHLPDMPGRADEVAIDEIGQRLDALDASVQGTDLRAVALRPVAENPHAVELAPGETTTVTLQFVNDGAQPLGATTYLRADVVPRLLAIGSSDDATVAARLPEGSAVAHGETASFAVPLTLDERARGRFDLQFTPVVNGAHSVTVAAVRLRVDVRESGLVRQVTSAAVDGGSRVLSTIVGVPAAQGAPVDRASVAAPAPAPAATPSAVDEPQPAAQPEPLVVPTIPERLRPVLPGSAPVIEETVGERPIRIRLAHAPSARLTVSASTTLRAQVEGAYWAPAGGSVVSASVVDGRVQLSAGKERTTADAVRFSAAGGGLVTLPSWHRSSTESTNPDDTAFRGTVELRAQEGKLLVINELPIEHYLYGLAEPSPSDPPEKIKALVIVARSYAQFYRDQQRKFPGAPYDLDDDPAVSQKYLGATYEQRAPTLRAAVDATRGQVVTFQGRLVKTPYFTSSLGQTKSAQEVWGWTETPYLVSVTDPCDAPRAAGHGVGLSGCGARVLAQQGATAEQILKHFYTGVDVSPRSDT